MIYTFLLPVSNNAAILYSFRCWQPVVTRRFCWLFYWPPPKASAQSRLRREEKKTLQQVRTFLVNTFIPLTTLSPL